MKVKKLHQKDGFYSPGELGKLGIKQFGENVKISRKASLYMPECMSFGHDVRIDDFCLLVGNIFVGSYVHICAYTSLHASSGSITLGDFSNISSRTAVYAASDDYSGKSLTNSVIPDQYKRILYSDIKIGRHSIIGTGSTLLPGAELPEGVALGAMSLVKGLLQPWKIYAGVPCRLIGERQKDLLDIEQKFLKAIEGED